MNTVLNSWKEIASYLDRGVRTVQRWQKSEELPVHRIGSGRRAPVFAFVAEIDLWLHESHNRSDQVSRATALRTDSRRIRKDTHLLITRLHAEVAKLTDNVRGSVARYESRQANRRANAASGNK